MFLSWLLFIEGQIMASVSDIKECINNLVPEYSVDVKEDFDNAAISFHIKKGVNSYVLKVSDGFIEGKNAEDIVVALQEDNFVTRMINAGSHPMILDDEGLRYLSAEV